MAELLVLLCLQQSYWVNEYLLSLHHPLETNLFANYLVLKHPLNKSDIIIFLHSKSRKKCHKSFENRFINKNLTPKNDLVLVFYMCKGGNPKFLN